MKDSLQGILDRINGLQPRTDEDFGTYIDMVKEALEQINTIQPADNVMLNTWKQMAKEELTKELNGRISDQFFDNDDSKKKTDFSFSKSSVTMSLTNIIMNL